MGVLAWIVGLLLAAGFIAAGASKVMGAPMMVQMRDRLGLSDGLLKGIGGLEILGGVGVFIGLLSSGDAELLGTAAAIGLIAMMIGAVVYHVRAGDPPKELVGSIMMLVLAILYIILLAAR
ncbi:MAG: DoxX family protein [Acidimicrobiales bacterium]